MPWALNAESRISDLLNFSIGKQYSQSKVTYMSHTKMFEFHSTAVKCLPWTFCQGHLILSTTKATVEPGSF